MKTERSLVLVNATARPETRVVSTKIMAEFEYLSRLRANGSSTEKLLPVMISVILLPVVEGWE